MCVGSAGHAWCEKSRRWVTQSAIVFLARTNVQEEVTGSRSLYGREFVFRV